MEILDYDPGDFFEPIGYHDEIIIWETELAEDCTLIYINGEWQLM